MTVQTGVAHPSPEPHHRHPQVGCWMLLVQNSLSLVYEQSHLAAIVAGNAAAAGSHPDGWPGSGGGRRRMRRSVLASTRSRV